VASRDRAEKPWRPTPRQLAAARGLRLRDVIAPGLRVLFVGINPGLYSGAVGHHFARPGNRFWGALRASGFTSRLLSAFEDRTLLESGIGVTNVCARTTARADELTPRELREGARRLRRKLRRYRPVVVAFLGIGAYRAAFGRPASRVGEQEEKVAGARVWLLPNPSGLNAHYQPAALARLFRRLRAAVPVRPSTMSTEGLSAVRLAPASSRTRQ
jgi:TDG/mug DNA glycosylase family protein